MFRVRSLRELNLFTRIQLQNEATLRRLLGKYGDKSAGSTFILRNCPGEQGQAVATVTASSAPGQTPSWHQGAACMRCLRTDTARNFHNVPTVCRKAALPLVHGRQYRFVMLTMLGGGAAPDLCV